MEEYIRKVHLLRDNIKAKNVVYNWHDPQTSYIEATLSRGDRRIGNVIENVWRAGGRLEAWSGFGTKQEVETVMRTPLFLFFAYRRHVCST